MTIDECLEMAEECLAKGLSYPSDRHIEAAKTYLRMAEVMILREKTRSVSESRDHCNV